MKTAISIPDALFEEAERFAKRNGMSRSELYATAVAQYLEALQDEAITRALDELYADMESKVDPFLLHLQLDSLTMEEW